MGDPNVMHAAQSLEKLGNDLLHLELFETWIFANVSLQIATLEVFHRNT